MADSEVMSPSHYNGAYEVDAAEAMRNMVDNYDVETPQGMPVTRSSAVWCGFALKYLWRWTRKGGLTDLRKAIRCIELAICSVEDQS